MLIAVVQFAKLQMQLLSLLLPVAAAAAAAAAVGIGGKEGGGGQHRTSTGVWCRHFRHVEALALGLCATQACEGKEGLHECLLQLK